MATLATASPRPDHLTIGLLPGESAPTVIRLNEPLRAYLEARLGIPVKLIVGANYAATGEALRFGRLDIAYLGPVTYVKQSQRVRMLPFARPTHAGVGTTFQAVIIVPADSPVKALTDLRGKEIAFGDPASTSGTWVPEYQLLAAGLVAGRDYRAHALGAHDAVALAVVNHRVAAGGLSLPVFNRLVNEKKLDPQAVRLLASSPPIPEYMWTFREGLDPAFREEVRQAFLAIRDPKVLQVFRATAFVPATDADVNIVRQWIAAIEKARR
jgi:phosphonate transport system substrate-binding protein